MICCFNSIKKRRVKLRLILVLIKLSLGFLSQIMLKF
uniref:Uncharacterized protein n=1 Tax=Arundo donax TaxID=35708 RepID=A0A0A9G6F5_ARUDO